MGLGRFNPGCGCCEEDCVECSPATSLTLAEGSIQRGWDWFCPGAPYSRSNRGHFNVTPSDPSGALWSLYAHGSAHRILFKFDHAAEKIIVYCDAGAWPNIPALNVYPCWQYDNVALHTPDLSHIDHSQYNRLDALSFDEYGISNEPGVPIKIGWCFKSDYSETEFAEYFDGQSIVPEPPWNLLINDVVLSPICMDSGRPPFITANRAHDETGSGSLTFSDWTGYESETADCQFADCEQMDNVFQMCGLDSGRIIFEMSGMPGLGGANHSTLDLSVLDGSYELNLLNANPFQPDLWRKRAQKGYGFEQGPYLGRHVGSDTFYRDFYLKTVFLDILHPAPAWRIAFEIQGVHENGYSGLYSWLVSGGHNNDWGGITNCPVWKGSFAGTDYGGAPWGYNKILELDQVGEANYVWFNEANPIPSPFMLIRT